MKNYRKELLFHSLKRRLIRNIATFLRDMLYSIEINYKSISAPCQQSVKKKLIFL